MYYSAASLTESRPEHMVFLQAGLCEREWGRGKEQQRPSIIFGLCHGPESHPKLTKVAYPLLGSNQCIQTWTVTLMDVLPYAWQYQE